MEEDGTKAAIGIDKTVTVMVKTQDEVKKQKRKKEKQKVAKKAERN